MDACCVNLGELRRSPSKNALLLKFADEDGFKVSLVIVVETIWSKNVNGCRALRVICKRWWSWPRADIARWTRRRWATFSRCSTTSQKNWTGSTKASRPPRTTRKTAALATPSASQAYCKVKSSNKQTNWYRWGKYCFTSQQTTNQFFPANNK